MKIDPDTYEAIVLRLRLGHRADRIAREVAIPSQCITADHVEHVRRKAHDRINRKHSDQRIVRKSLSAGEHNLELRMQDVVRNNSRGLAMAIRASKQREAGQ